MSIANYTVNVYWKALPFTDDYYRLVGAHKKAVDDLLTARVLELMPQEQQEQWMQLDKPNTNYDTILSEVNDLLSNEAPPPAGKMFVFPTPVMVQWVPTTTGHFILYSLRIADQGGMNEEFWNFSVTYDSKLYEARMGVNYECLLNE